MNPDSVMKTYRAYYQSPIGVMEIRSQQDRIISIDFVDRKLSKNTGIPMCLKECLNQLDEYFKGKRKTFSVNLLLEGTDFQKSVWRRLADIPYGQVVSYADIAKAIGKPTACRAVGSANGRNPIAIIIPCHRVIGSDGTLTGYGGGLWRKEWLLKHEKTRKIVPKVRGISHQPARH